MSLTPGTVTKLKQNRNEGVTGIAQSHAMRADS